MDMLCLLALRLLSAKSRAYAVACSYGFPLPASSRLLHARPTQALRTCYVCLLSNFYPLNLGCIAVACSSGFPLPASSRLLAARPTHALRCSRSFKTLVVRAPISVLKASTPNFIWMSDLNLHINTYRYIGCYKIELSFIFGERK